MSGFSMKTPIGWMFSLFVQLRMLLYSRRRRFLEKKKTVIFWAYSNQETIVLLQMNVSGNVITVHILEWNV